ncbi:MAG TPA: AAA family ATPase [Prolixibacteraceae bacterium]|nr:AAA family ATPase [Prolixibacteraceae bacterium]
MLQLLKEIILNAQEGILFTGTRRNLEVRSVEKKATILIGVRRCGKSTLLNQVISRLISEGVSKENFLYVNFFDDRLAQIKSESLDIVLEAYFMIYPAKKVQEKVYFFFDEIQVVQGWEAFIDRVLRTENCEVYLTGSSAKMLSKEIGTQMRGRALSWELFPFSFIEYLDHSGIKSSFPATTQDRILIQKSFENFYEQGGFPEVIGLDKPLRIKIHQEYFNSILFRDLIERYDIAHPKALVDLSRKLLENVASLYTLNGSTNFLKSLGHKVPKNSVAEYLSWFEDAYFLFTVRIFSASISKSNANPKKIYCIDHAFVRSVTSGVLVNSGHLLENIVFVALRRLNIKLYYYKTSMNQEIDFLMQDQQRNITLIQVCQTLVNPVTRQREISALQIAMNELGLSKSILVTQDESENIVVKEAIIEVIPIWKFLLDIR